MQNITFSKGPIFLIATIVFSALAESVAELKRQLIPTLTNSNPTKTQLLLLTKQFHKHLLPSRTSYYTVGQHRKTVLEQPEEVFH